MKILIIEDDPTLRAAVVEFLQRHGYETLAAEGGQSGLRMAQERLPDLVVLDIMMPGMDGWEVCRQLRATSSVPILMLTARTAQDDIIRGLELGADDYVEKPCSLKELDLRIRAILRRGRGEADDAHIYDDGRLKIDLERHVVLCDGAPVHLTPTEFRLLGCLVQHRDRAVTHTELLAAAWGPEYIDDKASLSVYIRYLREKLEETPARPRYLHTVWGTGYRFTDAAGKADH